LRHCQQKNDTKGGQPTVNLQQCIRGKRQKLPVAMPAVTGSSAQIASFAKFDRFPTADLRADCGERR